jgi:hypothetical protein
LHYRPEIETWARRGLDAKFFAKLDAGAGQKVFFSLDLALRDSPGAFIFLLQKWAAGVSEEHLDLPSPSPV